MNLFCVQRLFSLYFGQLGSLIARNPRTFIVIPIVLSAAMSSGLLFISDSGNTIYMLTSKDTYSARSKMTIDKLFPMNTSHNFEASRITSLGTWASVIVTCKDGRTVLREDIVKEIVRLDEIIRNITVLDENKTEHNYSQLCAVNYGKCDENEIIKIAWKIKEIEEEKSHIKYPVDYSNVTFNYTSYVKNLGGVSTKANGEVTEAEAIRLFYHLKNSQELEKTLSSRWFDAFIKAVEGLDLKNIVAQPLTTSILEQGISMHMKIAIPYGFISSILVFSFSTIVLMSEDWVKSKPWLAISGMIGIGLSIVSAVGGVVLCGNPFNLLVLMVGFLALAIGMDDVFVLMAAWRRTNPSHNVAQRMSSAYSEAAVSLTITSLSNMICFSLGAITPFPGIKLFCIFAAVSIFTTYLYQLTFFGGCMALSGYREEKKLHPFTFRPVFHHSRERGKIHKLLCSSIWNSEDEVRDFGLKLMQCFGKLISKPVSKYLLFVMYIAYLSASSIGILNLSVGLEDNTTYPDNSYPILYFKANLDYFSDYTDRVQVVIPIQLDYSKMSVQDYVEKMLKSLERNSNIASSAYTESWLRYYLTFIKSRFSERFLSAYDVSKKQDFIDALNNTFLMFPQTRHLREDIVFNSNHTEIIASRFMVQTTNLTESVSFAQLLENMQMSLKPYSPVFCYTPKFSFHESLMTLRTSVTYIVLVAAIIMFLALFVFIPDIRICLCGFCQIISIEIGIVGLMTFWGVKLNLISLVLLTMCVGLSVDYIAHLCYIFTISKKENANARFCEALRFVGVPVIEGALTSLLAVFPLMFTEATAFRIFCKIILLVCILSLCHALCFLPLYLNFCDAGCTRMQHSRELWTSQNFDNTFDPGSSEDEDSDEHMEAKEYVSAQREIIS